MNVEAIQAFHALLGELPADALLIFVGKDWENGEARSEVARLGLESRVRFLGRQDDATFADLIAAVDIGIAMRRPPTYGETSAALLDLLRHGVPSIITDTATFSSYPDNVVRKVRWEVEGLDGLIRAIRELISGPSQRATLGQSRERYVVEQHAWPRAAALYADVIERTHATRRTSRRNQISA